MLGRERAGDFGQVVVVSGGGPATAAREAASPPKGGGALVRSMCFTSEGRRGMKDAGHMQADEGEPPVLSRVWAGLRGAISYHSSFVEGVSGWSFGYGFCVEHEWKRLQRFRPRLTRLLEGGMHSLPWSGDGGGVPWDLQRRELDLTAHTMPSSDRTVRHCRGSKAIQDALDVSLRRASTSNIFLVFICTF